MGVYYGATYVEAQLCGGDEVVVVGGGNSAGQAAVFLAQTAKRVYMLVRSGPFSGEHVALPDSPDHEEECLQSILRQCTEIGQPRRR